MVPHRKHLGLWEDMETEHRRGRLRASLLPVLSLLLAFCCTYSSYILSSHAIPLSPSTKCVPTTSGCLYGSIVNSTSSILVSQYLGIPFAEPPVGPLRWRSPKPFMDPNSKRNATSFGPPCTQNSHAQIVGQEDCLYLNVWIPTVQQNPAAGVADQLLPVVMWIYGGSFVSGSNSDVLYNGANFVAQNSKVIIVAPNYRLGPFGFMSLSSARMTSPTNSSGNWGLEDQREAMRWIQMNIRSFGGNPDQVTVWGESAGAISTCLHLLSPLSAGLFHSAVLESGPCDIQIFKNGQAQIAELFVQSSGCDMTLSPNDQLSCLQNLNTSQVMEIGRQIRAFEPFGGDVLTRSFSPTVDGYNIPREPIDMFKSGDFNKVPLIAGSCANSAALFVAFNPVWLSATSEVLVDVVSNGLASIVTIGDTSAIYNYYVPSTRNFGGNDRDAVIAFLSDMLFICGSRRTLKYMYNAGMNNVYLYNWNHKADSSLASLLGSWMGAFHASDLPFLFGNLYAPLASQFSPSEVVLSQNAMNYWQRFVSHSASPNTVFNPLKPPTLVWPRFIPSTSLNIEFNLQLTVQTDYYSGRCDAWDNALGVSWSTVTPTPTPMSSGDSASLGIAISGLILSVGTFSMVLLIIRYLMNASNAKNLVHGIRPADVDERLLSPSEIQNDML